MVVVLAVLVLSYANSLRIFIAQQRAKAVAQQQIAERQADIDSLTDEITRWNDPTFVRAQARDRLGWVVPGETGYRVLGPDGQLLGGGAGIQAEGERPEGEHDEQWWEKLAGSIAAADRPAPAAPSTPSVVRLEPSPSASPSRQR